MTEVCVTWKQPDGDHFNGFCTNRFRLVTPPAGVHVDDSCDLCGVARNQYGVCTGCAVTPPRSYLATITIDGNGISGGTPDYGCGIASYSGDFILYYGPTNCVWSSSELELRAWSSSASGTGAVVCETYLISPRPRVTMTISTMSVLGVPKTVFTVNVNWYAGAADISGTGICSVIAQGVASRLDCYEPTSLSHYSRDLNFFPFVTTWANPYVNSIGGGQQITMTASVRPLSDEP